MVSTDLVCRGPQSPCRADTHQLSDTVGSKRRGGCAAQTQSEQPSIEAFNYVFWPVYVIGNLII